MENTKMIFYQGTYYNELFGAMTNFPVPTSQTKNKEIIADFKNRINKLLDDQKKESWPHKGKLILTMEIKGTKKYINRIDIDNVLKLLFDVLKKKVFIDDKQIFSIMASKIILENEESPELHGFLVGLRILDEGGRNNCIPELYSTNPAKGIGKGPTRNWKAIEI